MELSDAVIVAGIAENADKAYWLATAYALGNPRTRGIGKSMLSYGVRVSANVALHSAKGVAKGIARTPLKRGGKAPVAMLSRVGAKRAIGKGATRLAPVLGQVLLAYDTALIGGYGMGHVMPSKGIEKQGNILMTGFQA